MRRHADPFLLLLLAFSLVGNAYQYREFRGITPGVQPPTRLQPGDVVPPLAGVDQSGEAVIVEYARPTIVYVFAQSCGWCERNLDNIRALRNHTASGYQFVAVALEDGRPNLSGYLRQRNLDWQVVTKVPFELQGKYRISGTPLTLVIDPGGKIRHAWAGAWAADAEQIEMTFGFTLPGLVDIQSGG